jgi:hypothetical protein
MNKQVMTIGTEENQNGETTRRLANRSARSMRLLPTATFFREHFSKTRRRAGLNEQATCPDNRLNSNPAQSAMSDIISELTWFANSVAPY